MYRGWCCFVGLVVSLGSCGCATSSEPPAAKEHASIAVDIAWETNVEVEAVSKSVHAELDCSDCHADFEERGLDESPPIEDKLCRGCHTEADEALEASVHGSPANGAKGVSARCQDCHGAHDVRPADDKQSPTSKRNVVSTCAKCHESPRLDKQTEPGHAEFVAQYRDSVHGQELMQKGMVKAPSCVDCHGGGHDIHPMLDAKSPEQKLAVVQACDSCHSGVTRTYSTSVHGQALVDGDENAPTCANCHNAHGVRERGIDARMASNRNCGSCHEERLGENLETYHGRAHALGGVEVATCFDCHGEHDVLPSSNPASMVSPRNKLATCQKCHEDAPANLAGYKPHGDPGNRSQFPTLFWTDKSMKGLMLAALALFVLHAIGWGARNLLEFLRDKEAFREARWRRRQTAERLYGPAFRGIDRFYYGLLLVSVLLLMGTGLPLEYSESGWAQSLFALLGGADAARTVHHVGAALTVACMALHLARLLAAVWKSRGEFRDSADRFRFGLLWRFVFGPRSPLPTWRDIESLLAHAKWLVGRGPRPSFERYRYWERFDYVALFFGLAVIGASGLVMWDHDFWLRFLPGYAVNVAQIIHHEQALLVLGSLLTIHVGHLVPHLFPPRRP